MWLLLDEKCSECQLRWLQPCTAGPPTIHQVSNGSLWSHSFSARLQIAELIHVASLLHDDVIDAASTRRGLKALNIAFGNKVPLASETVSTMLPEHFGRSTPFTKEATLSKPANLMWSPGRRELL